MSASSENAGTVIEARVDRTTDSDLALRDALEAVRTGVLAMPSAGRLPTYIPELSRVPINRFGMHVVTCDGFDFGVGDDREEFSVQSISKVFSLAMAFAIEGERVWDRIGVEPTGASFNSVAMLEQLGGIPRNPFVNAGALVIADMLLTHLHEPEEHLLRFVRTLCGNDAIGVDAAVASSEAASGFMNAALANVLKHHGNLRNSIERVLRLYYFQCALRMSCADLARAFVHFADHRVPFQYGGTELTRSQVKRINALMMTCGFYDESGDFCYRVGLPGKSGVGGGIAALNPGEFAVTVWSPGLNEKGNSMRGMRALELLTTLTKRSVF